MICDRCPNRGKLRCPICEFTVCLVHQHYCCDCPVSMGNRKDVALPEHWNEEYDE